MIAQEKLPEPMFNIWFKGLGNYSEYENCFSTKIWIFHYINSQANRSADRTEPDYENWREKYSMVMYLEYVCFKVYIF